MTKTRIPLELDDHDIDLLNLITNYSHKTRAETLRDMIRDVAKKIEQEQQRRTVLTVDRQPMN